MTLNIALLSSLLSASAAHAEMPRYDVEAHCKQVASVGGAYSASLYNGCFDMEQSAYNSLRSRWDGLPASMRKHCDDVASFAGVGSYSLLEGCIRMEEDAARQPKKFEY